MGLPTMWRRRWSSTCATRRSSAERSGCSCACRTAIPGCLYSDLLNLQVVDGSSDDVAPALVEHLCNQALERGAQRVFVRLPDRDPRLSVFRLRGFRQYATEVVVYAEKPVARSQEKPDRVRPVKRGDNRLLYQLYRKVTPQGVSQLEAPTYRDWR